MQLDQILSAQTVARSTAEGEQVARAAAVPLIIFRLGSERFAIEIGGVREVIDAVPIVRYPESTPRHLGVINLRGSIVPVIQLRPELQSENWSRIIVFEDSDGYAFGFGADEVYKGEVEAAPAGSGSAPLQVDGTLVRYLSQGAVVALVEDER